MKTKKIIAFLLLLNGMAVPKVFAQVKDSTTAVSNLTKADAVIEEASKDKTVSKQKLEYISQVTKYGFRNLFSNYNYNPNLSYNVQVNPNAEQFIQDYMKVHGAYLQKMKGWGVPYFNFIEGILTQYGLPRELKYIAVIESNLQNGAISGKGACGPWQLMPETAEHLGLTINKYVDERTDYYKSTNAAARYLLSLYSQLNDWLLVMAAYNGGMGRVQYAITKSNSRDFWKLQYYLPEESRNYVKRFIATHFIMEGTGGVTTATTTDSKNKALSDSEQANIKELTITGKYNGSIIAKHLSMTMPDFEHYNPSFDDMLATSGSYDLHLPADKMNIFVAHKYDILNESVNALLGALTMPTSVPTTTPKHYNTGKKKTKTY